MKKEICVVCKEEALDDYEGTPFCGKDECGLQIEEALEEIQECGCR